MLQPLGFPIRYGASPNAAGMAKWNCDRRLGRLWRNSEKQRPTGTGSCHLALGLLPVLRPENPKSDPEEIGEFKILTLP